LKFFKPPENFQISRNSVDILISKFLKIPVNSQNSKFLGDFNFKTPEVFLEKTQNSRKFPKVLKFSKNSVFSNSFTFKSAKKSMIRSFETKISRKFLGVF
jgi:hypothetical protein